MSHTHTCTPLSHAPTQHRLPPYYTLLVRSLSVLEGIALASDPNYKVGVASATHALECWLQCAGLRARAHASHICVDTHALCCDT
jgi:hypothetical protein